MNLPGTLFNMPRSREHRTTYEEVALIGNGAYGTVYKARDLENNRYVALKKIKIPSNTQEHGIPMSTMREVATLKQIDSFNHPNIVKLLDVCPGNRKASELQIYLVFEHVEQDLSNYIDNYPSPVLPSPCIKRIMYEILSAIYFLHSNRIVHRDIKPQNILVTSEGQIKLADYGLSRVYSFQMTLTSGVVTLWYRAPEVLLQDTYCSAVDIWSCGCILAELYLKRAIFPGNSEIVQLCKIFDIMGLPLEEEWPNTISLPRSSFHQSNKVKLTDLIPNICEQGATILDMMLTFDQRQRITALTSLEHAYFEEEHKKPVYIMKPSQKLAYTESLMSTNNDEYDQQYKRANQSPLTGDEKRRRTSPECTQSSDESLNDSDCYEAQSDTSEDVNCELIDGNEINDLIDSSDDGSYYSDSDNSASEFAHSYDTSYDDVENIHSFHSNSLLKENDYLDNNDNIVKTV